MSTERTTVPGWWPAPPILVGLVAGAILVGVTIAKGAVDADSFWHVTAGQLMLDEGRVPSTDPFSFTWGGQPWTPHEWLSEVIMALLVTSVGTVGALVVFGIVAGAIPLVHAWRLGRIGLRTSAIVLASAATLPVFFPYLTLRPQILSWLLMAGLIWLLLDLRPTRAWRLAALPVLFAVWANLHGLYVVGFGFIGLYGLFTLAGRTPMAPLRWWVVFAGIGAVAASMLTPAGPEGLLYPLRYVDAGDWGLANIQEWQSPDFHNPAHWPLLVAIVALIANGGRSAPGWLNALSWVTVVMALVSLRNAPVAAVVALPVLAIGLDARFAPARVLAPALARRRRMIEVGLATVLIIASLAILVPSDPSRASMQAIERRYPIAALDRLVDRDTEPRLLAEYGWGGYAISRLSSEGGRVFVDGRNDMYPDEILDEYSTVRAADDGWEEILDRYEVTALLFSPSVPIVRVAPTAGWCETYRDDVQVLLERCPRAQ